MKNIKKFDEFVSEAMILATSSKKVEVPEEDINETITAITGWFENNPAKEVCNVSIFGHHIWPVHRDSIESDVKECATQALPYKKANEGFFDFLKSDTVDFTKPDKPKKKSKFNWRTLKDEFPEEDKPEPKPRAFVPSEEEEEEEEESSPYTKTMVNKSREERRERGRRYEENKRKGGPLK